MTFLIFSLTNVIVSILSDIKQSFSNEVDDWVNIFRIIGGLGAMITITTVYFQDQATGRPFSFANYSKSFVIMLMLILYKPIIGIFDSIFGAMERKTNNAWVMLANQASGSGAVMGFFSGVLGIFGGGSGGTNNEQSTYNSKGTPEAIEKMTALIGGNSGSSPSAFNGEILKGDESQYVQKTENSLTAVHFLKLLAETSGPTLRILARIILILLFITGPIAIGLGLFPPLKNSLTTWLTAYLKISLWIVISNILQYVIIRILTNPTILLSTWFNNQIGAYGEGNGAAIFYGAIVLSQTLVPTIASSLVASSGFDGLSYSMSQRGLQRANSFIKE
jgi:hypothetical protein